jgi:hypothetical protein
MAVPLKIDFVIIVFITLGNIPIWAPEEAEAAKTRKALP